MVLRALVVFLGLIIFTALTGCQEPYYPTAKTMKTIDGRDNDVQVVTEKDNGSLVYIKTGESLHIKLKADPTTGYLWTLAQDRPEILKTIGRPQFHPDEDEQGQAVGDKGTRTWIFLAAKTGLVNLKFIYHRPYEQDEQPARTFRVTINVLKGKTENYPYVQWEGGEEEFGSGQYY